MAVPLGQQYPGPHIPLLTGSISVMPGLTNNLVMPGLTGHLHHNVNVLVGPSQKTVPYVAPYHEGPQAHFPGCITHQFEYRMSQVLLC